MTVDQVGVCVGNLERSITFYRDIMGLEPVGRRVLADNKTERVAYRMGDTIFLLFYRPEFQSANPKVHAGLDHIAFTMDGKTFEAILAKVQERDTRFFANTFAKNRGMSSDQ